MGKRRINAEPESNLDVSKPVAERTEFVIERFGNLHDADRSFDIEYWQRQGDAAIFQAAWELAELYHLDRGMTPDELRLDRSVEHFECS
jgi:hypothetical protein